MPTGHESYATPNLSIEKSLRRNGNSALALTCTPSGDEVVDTASSSGTANQALSTESLRV